MRRRSRGECNRMAGCEVRVGVHGVDHLGPRSDPMPSHRDSIEAIPRGKRNAVDIPLRSHARRRTLYGAERYCVFILTQLMCSGKFAVHGRTDRIPHVEPIHGRGRKDNGLLFHEVKNTLTRLRLLQVLLFGSRRKLCMNHPEHAIHSIRYVCIYPSR